MKNILFAGSVLAAFVAGCGNDRDSEDVRPVPVQIPERVKPAPLKVSAAMKKGFVETCEAAATDERLAGVYATLKTYAKATTCGSAFDAIAKTREVTLGTRTVSSLRPLVHLPFVERVDIFGPTALELAYLSELPNLQYVGLWDSDVRDLEFLKGFKHLTSVNIDNSPVTSVAPLVDVSTLRFLTIGVYSNHFAGKRLPKDESHCPVKSKNAAVNEGCRAYRGVKN